MPIENNFQHDELSRKNPGDRLVTRDFAPGPDPGSPAWHEALAGVGLQLAQAGVRAVMWLHGSIPGTDVFGVQRLDEVGGLKRGYSRGVAGLDALLTLMRQGDNGIPPLPAGLAPPLPDDETTTRLLDDQVGDAGNVTVSCLDSFDKAINQKLPRPIVCERILWSSEHHHLGRAMAACTFLHRISRLCADHQLGPGDRVLVLAHGQAGLVLALASNLLTPTPLSGRTKLFSLLTAYAAQQAFPGLAATIRHLEELLKANALLGGAVLDVVTFGAPVRYGWDPSGLGKLLHIVNHRTLRTDGKTWLAKMELPQITIEMPIAWGGDYVQQLATAGSDAMPATDSAKAANKAVWELVEPYDGFERWLECARRAVRFPCDGRCLLVDYKDCTGSANPRDHYYGHAAYTRRNAMLFNATQIVQLFYPA